MIGPCFCPVLAPRFKQTATQTNKQTPYTHTALAHLQPGGLRMVDDYRARGAVVRSWQQLLAHQAGGEGVHGARRQLKHVAELRRQGREHCRKKQSRSESRK